MEIIQSLLGFFIAIGILVTFHEFGHFYVARLFNVTVLNFSIGFGKNLITRKFKGSETEYSIGAIPLGGYVKMLESEELDKLDKNNPNYREEFCFDKQSVYKRFLVVAAGPLFNLILAVIFFVIVHVSGITGVKPFLEGVNVSDKNLFSENTNFEITHINQIRTQRWQDVRVEILNSIIEGNTVISLELMNSNGVKSKVQIPVQDDILKKEGDIITNIGLMPLRPDYNTELGFVENDSAASLAGLQQEDVIKSINDQSVSKWSELVSIIKDNPSNILSLKVERNQKIIDVILVPSEREVSGNVEGFAGIAPDRKTMNLQRVTVKYPFLESVIKSYHLTADYTIITFKMIIKLFSGQANMANISGPLSIAEFSGKSLSMGYVYFAYLLAVLSISLGVLNLLPIPVLDGGHLVYYSIEMLIGKPVSMKFQLIGQQIGLVLLFGIMVIAFYNDFLRIFSD